MASLAWLYSRVKTASNPKSVFCITFCWLFALYLGTMYWIVVPMTINDGEFIWLIPFAITFVPAFLAAFQSCFICLSSAFGRSKHFYFLAFTAFWCLGEVAVVNLPILGFPWNLMGYVWSFSVYTIQSASLFGIYGLSALFIVSSAVLGEAICTPKRRVLLAGLAALIVSFNFLLGVIRLYTAGNTEFTDVKIAIVQSNIPQELKWRNDQLYANLKLYVDATMALPDDIDIVIWPESAVPFPFCPDGAVGRYVAALNGNKRLIVTGGVRYSPEYDGSCKLYNSMFTIAPDGCIESCYDKQILLPFGEYIPFRKIIPIKKITDGTQDYSPGNRRRSTLRARGVVFIPKVCSEIVFPIKTDKAGGASAILNIANDGWFGKSSEPYQHLAIARIRCVELGLPLIRVSNAGISAVFDSYGREVEKVSLGQSATRIFLMPKSLNEKTSSTTIN
jgi:apolipoprotein N-acyltransferase